MSDNKFAEMEGKTLFDQQGEKIGKVNALYLDEDSTEPKWATISSGLFGAQHHLMPLEGVSENEDGLVTSHSKETIMNAPHIDVDEHLDEAEAGRLRSHYSMNDGDESERQDTGGVSRDHAMTRSEEELRVGTERHEVGRVRLRKYIVTENQQFDVPVEREVLRVERQPMNGQSDTAAEIHEDEQEVVLHSERPVVNKEVVSKERVRMVRDTVQEQQPVFGEVRKEVVEEERTDK
ncbi:MAG TPA: PRC and DUF2382 domain-containing protein [Candidatus Saccharimonadia bacterium]|nr:PRC and DUF2382 domain-containing protein [Candidatus Saccharimonadia bacterium]